MLTRLAATLTLAVAFCSASAVAAYATDPPVAGGGCQGGVCRGEVLGGGQPGTPGGGAGPAPQGGADPVSLTDAQLEAIQKAKRDEILTKIKDADGASPSAELHDRVVVEQPVPVP